MVSVLLLVFIINSVAFYPFAVLFFVEVLTALVSIFHARRPSLGVLLIYLALEIGKALAAITLALVTVLYDHDKDCEIQTQYLDLMARACASFCSCDNSIHFMIDVGVVAFADEAGSL
ncbi:unnamed protein product [Angiostrongylus costaricensis]|uniref:G_PROTEIN_RECEP_F1_2 domain-containing protein n=1 Tax=Angiostrongylus costaricensis TaxID=334426 RepID=A0A0R3PV99_ANGCS|nr:unnamed protein product [Angiostrongylus costaricensis]